MKINKATFEALPEAIKAAFKVNPDNAEEYDNGEESAPELKAALARQKEELTEKGKKLSEFETEKQKEIEAAKKKALEEARSTGDFKTIEDDYKRQLRERDEKLLKVETDRIERIKNDSVSKAASDLAKIFVSPALATAAIKSRLQADVDADGNAIIRVTDKDGKPSGMSVEDLKKEYLTDKELKGSIVASMASGGESTFPTGGGESTSGDKKFDAKNAKPSEMVAHLKSKGAVKDSED
jgi:hypothetical protein